MTIRTAALVLVIAGTTLACSAPSTTGDVEGGGGAATGMGGELGGGEVGLGGSSPGSDGPDRSYGVTATPTGEIVAVGVFNDTMDFGGGSVGVNGDSDAFVVRLSP